MDYSIYDFINSEKEEEIINKYFNSSSKAKMSCGVLINNHIYSTDNNLFYIGSISKVFTSLLVLKTINKYNIDIHTNINIFLKLKSGNYPTIYECLTHTSRNYFLITAKFFINNLLFSSFQTKNPYENVKSDVVLKCLEKKRFSKHKEKKYHYSDLNYALLAIVLEKIEKRKIKELLQDFITNDLKLKNTYVGNFAGTTKSVLRDKYIDDWVWYCDNPYLSAGGIISNSYDMLVFSKIIIDSDLEYIKNASIICPESKRLKNDIMTTYSFHTFKKSNQLWHVGVVGTHRSMIIINKVKKYAVITLSNAKGVKNGNASYVCKMIYGDIKRKKKLLVKSKINEL